MGIFKSYDIRGIYPSQLDASLGTKIGAALGAHFQRIQRPGARATRQIVVGRDMRISAPEMTKALIDGLRAAGCDVIDIGMVTTPCTYFAIQRLDADGGVMVTASHNPAEYIGFKVCRELAIPISLDTGLAEVEQRLNDPLPKVERGSLRTVNLDEAYLDFVAAQVHDLRPITVAADASNGMAGKFLKPLFSRLPCTLKGIYLEPDGTFPHHQADPLKTENLKDLIELVKKTKADIGFCFDGDADRVAIVDENGDIVGCDLITALIASDLLERQPGKPVTYDLRSSKVVREVIADHGGQPVRGRVGHAHIKQTMRQIGAISGGELSGHYYFQLHDQATFFADSALVACVHLLDILSKTGKKTSELIAPMRKYFHSGEVNFNVADKDAALADIRATFRDGKQDTLDGISVEYSDWWFNVRPSNTEPLLRLTLEGDTAALRDKGFQRVLDVLNKYGQQVKGGH